MDEDRARKLLRDADPAVAKRAVVSVAAELDGLAAQVWAFGLAEGPRWALAVVSQMGAELAVAAATLFELERWYAGMALVRQLIEVEYLLFLFATDSEEPERWLAPLAEDARRMFSPAAMRERARDRFRWEEYASHCEMGGHPRKKGHVLLREHAAISNRDFKPGVEWVDLAQHVERMWSNYVKAVARHSPTNVYPERFARVDASLAAWRAADPEPDRI